MLTSLVVRDLHRFDLSYMCVCAYLRVVSALSLLHPLCPEDVEGAIQNGRIVEHDDAAVGPRLDVQTATLAVFVILTTEVVTYGLHRQAEVFGNAVNGAIRQAVLDRPEFVECDCSCHGSFLLFINQYLCVN